MERMWKKPYISCKAIERIRKTAKRIYKFLKEDPPLLIISIVALFIIGIFYYNNYGKSGYLNSDNLFTIISIFVPITIGIFLEYLIKKQEHFSSALRIYSKTIKKLVRCLTVTAVVLILIVVFDIMATGGKLYISLAELKKCWIPGLNKEFIILLLFFIELVILFYVLSKLLQIKEKALLAELFEGLKAETKQQKLKDHFLGLCRAASKYADITDHIASFALEKAKNIFFPTEEEIIQSRDFISAEKIKESKPEEWKIQTPSNIRVFIHFLDLIKKQKKTEWYQVIVIFLALPIAKEIIKIADNNNIIILFVRMLIKESTTFFPVFISSMQKQKSISQYLCLLLKKVYPFTDTSDLGAGENCLILEKGILPMLLLSQNLLPIDQELILLFEQIKDKNVFRGFIELFLKSEILQKKGPIEKKHAVIHRILNQAKLFQDKVILFNAIKEILPFLDKNDNKKELYVCFFYLMIDLVGMESENIWILLKQENFFKNILETAKNIEDLKQKREIINMFAELSMHPLNKKTECYLDITSLVRQQLDENNQGHEKAFYLDLYIEIFIKDAEDVLSLFTHIKILQSRLKIRIKPHILVIKKNILSLPECKDHQKKQMLDLLDVIKEYIANDTTKEDILQIIPKLKNKQ